MTTLLMKKKSGGLRGLRKFRGVSELWKAPTRNPWGTNQDGTGMGQVSFAGRFIELIKETVQSHYLQFRLFSFNKTLRILYRTMIGNNKMLIFLALSITDNCLCVNPSPGCSKPLPSIPRPGHSHNHPIQAGATSLLSSQYAGFRPFAGTRVSSIPHPPPAPLARCKQHCTASLGGLPGLDREHDRP